MTDTDRQSGLRRAIAGHLGLALAFSVLVNTLFLASPLYMMQLYGRVLDSRSLETLASLSVVLVLALVAMAAADAARGRLLVRASARLERRLAQGMTGGGRRHGDRLRDLATIRTFFAGSAATTLCDAPFTVLFLVVLFMIHPLLGLVATAGAAVILFAVLVTRWTGTAREKKIGATDASLRDLSLTLDADRGELDAIGARDSLRARLGGTLADGAGLRQGAAEQTAALGAFNRMVRMLAHSGALATGAVLTLDGQLVPAAMLASAILAGRALGPMETLLTAMRQAGAARDAFERLTESERRAETARPVALEGGAGVSVRRAMLMPKGGKRPAIRSINIELRPGELVSVAGPSGSGKSTLARAIAGIAPLTGGLVRVAGTDPGAMDPAARARLIGWMGQEATLYPGTVAENIARFTDAAWDDIAAAAERAGVTAAIEALPDGFETQVGPAGTNLTPGTRQRIAFARALFGNPSLVILDQPTSHADAEGEVAALNALRALKAAGTTVIVISHKPVLAAHADRILVMKDGTVEHFERREDLISLMRRPASGAMNADERPVRLKEAAT